MATRTDCSTRFWFFLYLFFGRGLTDKKKFYLQQSDLRELENFQNFQEESFELYSQKMPTEEQLTVYRLFFLVK